MVAVSPRPSESTALAIPDPRHQPVPIGWAEAVAAPAILETDDWDALDEYEARLRAFASFIDSYDGDAVEFEKALRLVEKRRGDMLGAEKYARLRTFDGDESSHDTKERWRKLARHWDELWPLIRDTRNRKDVTQAALLKRIEMGVHYSSATDEWATPPDLFKQLNDEFGFDLDVCALPGNAKCARYFSPEHDGLSQPWDGVCWMNPPYGGEIGKWVAKADASAQAGATVVTLLPARVDTSWWWNHCRHAEIRFLKGRLKFGDGTNSAPFPSAIVIFGRPAGVIWWER